MKTPEGNTFAFPKNYSALAFPLLQEWANVDPKKLGDYKRFPLSGRVMSIIDSPFSPQDRINTLQEWLNHDTILYRAKEPSDLAEMQSQTWDKILKSLKCEFALEVTLVYGLETKKQDAEPLIAFLKTPEPFQLASFQEIAGALHSVLLALAILHGEDAEEMFEASLLEETYNINKWGKDEEASKRRETLKTEFLQAIRFFNLLKAA